MYIVTDFIQFLINHLTLENFGPGLPRPAYLLDNKLQIKGMQQITTKFKLLIVMNRIEDIGTDLQEVLNKLLIPIVIGLIINIPQQLTIPLISILLKLLIGIDLVRLGLHQPSHRLGLDVELLLLGQTEQRGRLGEYLVEVYCLVLLQEEELSALGVLLRLDRGEF